MNDGAAKRVTGTSGSYLSNRNRPRLSPAVWLACLLAALCVGHQPNVVLAAQAETESPEEMRQRRAAERFLLLLQRNPRRGTALERVYGYHVERGTLDEFVQSLRDRTTADESDGEAWMLLGLIESHRGQDASAVEAFREAERTRGQDPLAAYYLGQALLLVGQPEQAVAAFERAIERNPERADMLEIFETLGRVHQRAQRHEQALEVWNRLEGLFPGDQRIQQEIATILAEEGDHEGALKRFEVLAEKSTDRYEQVTFAIKAAELKVRLDRSDDAIGDFERLLGNLNPESWLYREVRSKIENVFLKTDDVAGLSRYYESWIESHPQDVDAMARVGRILSLQGRAPEAQRWLIKALELAPSRERLRIELINYLARDNKLAEAAAQYEELVELAPNNPDYIVEWGNVLLQDSTKPEPQRKSNAAEVWERLIENRPDDPVTVSQTADLFREADMPERALVLYQRAVELAPSEGRYREYLGEYYHSLERSEEAVATWKQIAEGESRTVRNLMRLGEVLAGFGYGEEAVEAMREAAAQDLDLADRLRYAQLLRETAAYDEAMSELDKARAIATTDDDRRLVLAEEISNLVASERLPQRIEALSAQLEGADGASADKWHELAAYLEAAREYEQATVAIRKALQLAPDSVMAWTTAAHLHETAGSLADAVDANRKLAAIDRRYRTEYLKTVSNLEMRLGRHAEALQAAQDLIEAAPGNPEHYEFYAAQCFQLGKTEEGLDALRRSVRVNPSDPEALLTLASALSRQFRTDEAIELNWRAFERDEDLESRLGVIDRLTELYLRTNHLDRLVGRLNRQAAERNEKREMRFYLARAFRSAGDFGSARVELESLLGDDSRDTQLLTQLSELAESEEDFEAAARYQARINEIAPSREGDARIATLYLRTGEIDEAEAVWMRVAEAGAAPDSTLRAIDNLLSHSKFEAVLSLTERVLRDQPDNWEALYRFGVALDALDRNDEAEQAFQAILKQDLPDEELGAIGKSNEKRRKQRSNSVRASLLRQNSPPIQTRLGASYQIRRAIGLDPNYYYSGSQQQWGVSDFGQARMVALAWLYRQAEKQDRLDEYVDAIRPATDAANLDDRAAWDWYYLQHLLQDYQEIYRAARQLSRTLEPSACYAYLLSLPQRFHVPGVRRNPGAEDNIPALPADEVDHVLECHRVIQTQRPEWLNQQIIGSTLAELTRAERTTAETELYTTAFDAAQTVSAMQQMMSVAAGRGDLQRTFDMLGRIEQALAGQSTYLLQAQIARQGQLLAQLVSRLSGKKNHTGILEAWQHYSDLVNRVNASGRNRSRPMSRSRQQQQRQFGMSINIGGNYRYVRFDYPQENAYFSTGSIQLLRHVYEHYKQSDLLSDLEDFLREHSASTSGRGRAYDQLALAYVQWWDDRKEIAVEQMELAVAAVPQDAGLRLELGRAYQLIGLFDDALAAIDAVEPLNHVVMQQRELLALQLAVRSGNIERARQAAERLFGLRLHNETQMALAGEMHQLGMHKLAEAVLVRSRLRAGNRSSSLVALMQQYQRQGQTDVAIQIAHRILRTSSTQPAQPGRSNPAQEARTQALQVLARSGNLEQLVERAEAQLERAPTSVRLHQQLADYYQAAGNKQKSREVVAKIADLRPKDARLRFQLAKQVERDGEFQAAAEFYLAAFRMDPALFTRDSYNLRRVFEQARRVNDLVEWLESIDLKSLGRYYVVSNVISDLLRNSNTRSRGIELFRRAWKAYPTYRAEMLGSMYDDRLWRTPEMYDYAREAVLPSAQRAQLAPWSGVDQIRSWSGDGTATGVVTRLLTAARKQNKLDSLRQEVEQRVEDIPQWLGGQALLAVLSAQRGDVEAAETGIEKMLGDERNPIPANTCWLVGQELLDYEELSDIVLRLYESAAEDSSQSRTSNFSYSPNRRLVKIYEEQGKTDTARALLLKFADEKQDHRYDPGYQAYQRLRNAQAIGEELLNLGFAVDALRVQQQAVSDPNTLANAERYGGSYFKRQVDETMQKTLDSMDAETLIRSLELLTNPPEPESADDEFGKPAAINLVMVVQPNDLESATLRSYYETALDAGSADTETLSATREKIQSAVDSHPDDLSVRIAAALLEFAAEDEQQIERTINAVVTLVESSQLEPLGASGRANARQRAEAEGQIPLWLVARKCWKHERLRSIGDRLFDRALEAAKRQADNRWALAILRERGGLALESGDRQAAEGYWTLMLHLILNRPPQTGVPAVTQTGVRRSTVNTAAAGTVPARFASATAAPADPQSPRQAAKRRVPALTIDRYEQAMQAAKLAMAHGFDELSLTAVREALAGGPPIPLATNNRSRGVVASPGGLTASQGNLQIDQKVEKHLSGLSAEWRRRKISPQAIYETLAAAVLPQHRPGEIFFYPRPLGTNVRNPSSVAWMLVDWATRADQVDNLRKRVESRRDQPRAALGADVMLVQIALATGDSDAAAKQLQSLQERLNADAVQYNAELSCHASVPALFAAETFEAALPTAQQAANNMSSATTGASPDTAGAMLLLLARLHYKQGDRQAGRKQLDEYLRIFNASNIRYSGDSGVRRRKQQLLKVAGEYVRAAQLDDALKTLGEFADITISIRYGYGSDGNSFGLAGALGQQLLAIAPQQRYELLKSWTFPTETRKSLRSLAFIVPDDAPPAIFLKDGQAADIVGPEARSHHSTPGLFSTINLLVSVAEEVGELEQLASEASDFTKQKVENADLLLITTHIALGQGKSVKSKFRLRDSKLKLAARGNAPDDLGVHGYLLASAALDDSDLADLGEVLMNSSMEFARRRSPAALIGFGRRALAVKETRRFLGDERMSFDDPNLAFWSPASHDTAGSHAVGSPPACWVAHGGYLRHLFGTNTDVLFFKYPLKGSFQFSCDVHSGTYGDMRLGYGGLIFQPSQSGSTGSVINAAGQQVATFPFPFVRSNAYNRLTLQVEPGSLRFLVNGYPYYETEDLGETACWLSLLASTTSRTACRNFRLSGNPEIPRDVALIDTDRLPLWTTRLYGEQLRTQPPDLDTPGTGVAAQQTAALSQSNQTEFDWLAEDGTIRGRRVGFGSRLAPRESLLRYTRPLEDGDSVAYEFLYEPGEFEVHPALGRLSFVLAPDGIKLHWLTDGPAHETPSLALNNAVVLPAQQRGPRPLPLAPGAWNKLILSLAGDSVTIVLNDAIVYESEGHPAHNRVFGLFHYKDQTAVRVRNVVLRGNWPQRLSAEMGRDLLAHANDDRAQTTGRARHFLVSEEFFSASAFDVLRHAQTLQPEERFEYLKDWVLPNDGYPSIRLYADLTPFNPVGPREADAAASGSDGRLSAPALLLVETGKELGRLAELKQAASERDASSESRFYERNRLAFRFLLALAENDLESASNDFKDLQSLIRKAALNTPVHERWPDVIAAYTAAANPHTAEAAAVSLNYIVEKQIDRKQIRNQVPPIQARNPAGQNFRSATQHARSLAERNLLLAAHPDADGAAHLLESWHSGSRFQADSRGDGHPLARWAATPDTLHYLPGHADDKLFFNRPLTGDFEVDAELSAKSDLPIQVAYSGLLLTVSEKGKKFALSRFGEVLNDGGLSPALKPTDGWYRYHMEVQDGVCSVSIGDRELYRETLPAKLDPWLTIDTTDGKMGAVKNLKISGAPSVPACVDLSAERRLAGWKDYFPQVRYSQNAALWEKRGNTIYGRKQSNAITGSQSVLQYYRPLGEDGKLAYEFYYDPDKSLVHPALDRLAFLIDPQDIQIHWITDGQFDRTGSDPNNATKEPHNRRGAGPLPLVPGEWNQATLAVSGDMATLSLNGVEVFQRQVSRSNQRIFGFFRYPRKTDGRIRNVTWCGDWPTSAPSTPVAAGGP